MNMSGPVLPLRALLLAALYVCVAARVNAQSVTTPWNTADIGGSALRSSATVSSGVFTITAAGTDIGGASDEFGFVYQRIAGDVDIIARVDALDAKGGYATAGVMIRKSLAADSAHTFGHVSARTGVRAARRLVDGGNTTSAPGPGLDAPVWLRATRKGRQVSTFWSFDGTSWTPLATDLIAFNEAAYVGIGVNSRSSSSQATAVVSHISVAGGQPSAPLPSGQEEIDIGEPAIAGTTGYAAGTYTITAAGADIWDRADQFHFVYQPISGNVEIVARVVSIAYIDDWSKAGIMIRESLTASSRHASVFLSPANGFAFQRRPVAGEESVHTAGGESIAPGWVRLVRTGDLFEAYRSADGASWTKIGSDSIGMGDTAYVGLAVTSHATTAATTAVIDELRITADTAINNAPAVSLTVPEDGASFSLPATVTLSATATDPENRLAAVDFYAGSSLIARAETAPYEATWSAASAGVYPLTAVAHDADGGSTTSSAVNVTITSPTNEPPVISLSTGATTFVAPASITLTATATDPENRLVAVDFYAGAVLIARDTTAPYETTWSATTAGSYPLTAVAYDADGGSTTSDTVNVTITSPANKPPVISLATSGTTFVLPASITVTATATDPEDRLAAVDFYAGAVLIARDTTAPYETTWSATIDGSYPLTAVALDADGGTATSNTVTVTITTPIDMPPAISLSTGGTTFVAPASITLTAVASDPEGQLARVEFYNGTTRLTSASSAPYTFTWTNVPAGSYRVAAVAYDAAGSSATSATATIVVTAPPVSTATAPVGIAFTASSDHTTTVVGYRLDIFASSANIGTDAPVASSDLGKPAPDATNAITVDRTAFFQGLAAGKYLASVAAIGSQGQTRSEPVAFDR